MRAVRIQWDCDGDKAVFHGLPSEMDVPAGMTDPDEISDYLTETTGFCHFGFELERGPGDPYHVEIHYAAVEDCGETQIAIYAGDPEEKADYGAIARTLSETLETDLEYDGEMINSILAVLPDTLVARIKQDAIDEYEKAKAGKRP